MELKDEEVQPMDVLGTSGLKSHSGIIDEEFMTRLRGKNAIKIYTEMINNSPIVASALNAINWLIRQVEWRIEPADESDAAIAEAEDTEAALEDMSHTFSDFISEALSMIWAGYAPFEIIYKIRRGPDNEDSGMRSKFSDGKFGWRKIEIRAQDTLDRWEFDDEGGLEGMIQMNMYGEQSRHGPVFIPIEKMLLFRVDKYKNNPEGKSILRPAVIPYWYTKRIQEFEAIGIERNLAGMPIMEVPAEILINSANAQNKKARAQFERFVTQVRMDERWGGLVPSETKPDGSPSGYKFKLMQSAGRKLVDTDVIIKRYRNDMFRVFMTQFLTLGQDGVGSFSLSSDMTSLFGTAIGTIMDSITDVINRYMIPRRQKLNGIAVELSPVLVHGDIEGPKLETVAAYISALSKSGVITPHPALERKLMEIGGLPQPPDEEELVGAGLSEQTIDSVGKGSMDSSSVSTILSINKSLKLGELDRLSAIAILASSLGIEESAAEKFIPKETPDNDENKETADLEVEPDDETTTEV